MPLRKLADIMKSIGGSAQTLDEPLEPFVESFPPQPKGQAIMPSEVGETLPGCFEEDIVCICGGKMKEVDCDAWGIENEPIRMIGFFSCSTVGCAANFKEKHDRIATAMGKLTEDEMKALGLWNWNAPKKSVDVAAQLP